MKHMYLPSIVTFLSIGWFSVVNAAPWMDTQDAYLRANIIALANAGVIHSPVNTYPLMNKSISRELQSLDIHQLPPHLAFALQQVQQVIAEQQRPSTTSLKIKGATNEDGFQSFGERHSAQGELSISNEIIKENFAFKSNVHLTANAYHDHKKHYEGSYLAGFVGNWLISIDQLPVWWGPGIDTNLALSNNAIAFPALRLTRHDNRAIDWPGLRWLGPISFTTYLGKQEHSNERPNILTWGARMNIKPHPNLELGFTRTAQWGGDGRPDDLQAFKNLLMGNDNVKLGDGEGVSREEEPGNQLGGLDLRWNTQVFNQSIGIYAEIIGEDEAGNLPSHTMHQVGVATSFGDMNGIYQAFIEYTDTFVNCSGSSAVGNCAYEHHLYKEGYRRYGRSMGSTYDSDAQVLTFGLRHSGGIYNGGTYNGKPNKIKGVKNNWYGKVKLMRLNKDNLDRSSFPHPISQHAQRRIQLEAGYQLPLFNGSLELEAVVYHSKFEHNQTKDHDASLKGTWTYHF